MYQPEVHTGTNTVRTSTYSVHTLGIAMPQAMAAMPQAHSPGQPPPVFPVCPRTYQVHLIIDTENYRDLQENFRAYNFVSELEIRAVGVLSRPYNQGTYGRCSGMARRPLTV
jgi:hypothetical protein